MEKQEILTYNLRTGAAAAGLSAPTFLALLHAGEIPALRCGRRWVIPRASLEQWLVKKAEERGQIGGGE